MSVVKFRGWCERETKNKLYDSINLPFCVRGEGYKFYFRHIVQTMSRKM